jgi:hypothetical protein
MANRNSKAKSTSKGSNSAKLPVSLSRPYDVIQLRLSKGLNVKCSRIGYEDEGLRLQIFDVVPFNFHVELQLSKADCLDLIELLKDNYEDQKDNNWR